MMQRYLFLLITVASTQLSWHASTAFVPTTTTQTSRATTNSLFRPQTSSKAKAQLNIATLTTTTRRSSSSSLGVISSVAAVAGVVSGGVVAGGLHAIAGPDHLAAILPKCMGQRWYRACRVGALWGMGHGISATIMGVAAFFAKNRLKSMGHLLHGANMALDICVGASLILIGIMGIKEARDFEVPARSLSAAASPTTGKSKAKRAVIFNGLLHGFSWDGAPSLAPALAVATWAENLAFLLAYGVGTIAAMTIVTTAIGEGTQRAGEMLDRPDIPQKLAYFSSMFAVLIGSIWCGLAFV
mmetsp:Transcript_18178/g.26908  ORF Transcript_18178/g.26908 Transcript_18178/m.26908 type:complete len:299 (-) Transcript_18178:5-901(-)